MNIIGFMHRHRISFRSHCYVKGILDNFVIVWHFRSSIDVILVIRRHNDVIVGRRFGVNIDNVSVINDGF